MLIENAPEPMFDNSKVYKAYPCSLWHFYMFNLVKFSCKFSYIQNFSQLFYLLRLFSVSCRILQISSKVRRNSLYMRAILV